MKTFFSFTVLMVILAVLGACSTNPEYSVLDSAADFPVQITELSVAQREILSAEYTPNGYDEGIVLSNIAALNLYDAMDFKSFKEIAPGKNFHENLSNVENVSFWLFTDRNDLIVGSKGCFSVNKNDIVYYSLSPITSFAQYFKAPDGTYDTVKAIIEAAINE